MTLRDKLKHMLHPSGHKKSPSSSPPTNNASPPAGSPTPYKPGPNKPPNARDPGFRKSFNLGERPESNGSTTGSSLGPNETGTIPQSIPVNGSGRGKMQTLDKYGDDYLAVSPRTNVTVPEGPSVNRGLSTIAPLDEEAKAVLGAIQEHKPNANDSASVVAKKLDGLSLQQPEQTPQTVTAAEKKGQTEDS
ncbi:hypothetical protein ABW19_dt0204277 [Dactylella cylindrospora]|nr:hypothetical protein ABW19_dt0204277 [Dactylella cylindrospora]